MVTQNYTAEYLSSILKSFNDLIFLFNDDGVILEYLQNEDSDWLYVPKEQFIGKHHREVLPPDVSDKIDEAIATIRHGSKRFAFDYSLSIKGIKSWFTAVFTPMIHEPKGRVDYVCLVREISERKEKELLLQGVLDNAFNAFMVLKTVKDKDGSVTDFEWKMVNHKAEKLIGQSLDLLKNHRLTEMSQQPWMLFNEYMIVARTGNPLDLEYSYEQDNTKVWMHTHASRLDNGIVVTIRDITEKKRSEVELQAAFRELSTSRQRLDMFFSQALSGFFFMMLDQPVVWDDKIDRAAALDYAVEHLRFTQVNNALLHQYGARYDQFINLTIKDFFKGDIATARQLLTQLYDRGYIQINRGSKKTDGSTIWLEGYYKCLTDEHNRILGHFGIQHDITDRKRAEDALRSSEERYRLLANNMLDLVVLHDPDGKYKYVSPSVTRLLGYAPEELIGTDPYILFHPNDISAIREESHKKAVEGSEIQEIEYRIRKKDGEYIWLSTNTKPIADPDGKVIMLQTVSRDVTEKIKTRQLLEELNHQKNKLFSIIAHDLRGPLGSCMGLLELMQKTLPGEDLQKYLQLARRSAFNLHDLMEDLLLWAGSQLDKVSFDPTIVNVKEEIEHAARRFGDMAQSKNIALAVDVKDDSLSVYADRDMIRTVIRNLLSNAIKFTRPGGRVALHAKSTDGHAEISVSDTGIGVKPEDIDKLFSKTSTFTTYGTQGEKGTGLGLDICKDFVDRHHGTIRADSKPGEGSTFVFTLPEF